ncbi:MAG TPA: beta-ketoacyl-[acyl-carrier-protein] synthase family protein [Candidatus Bathyarchaeia archaeon]|nr:beta-ketoacyl-[acyl-carrier-protein] synthase family protein [Candidatus Bathyarchaeia archaeon]
MVEPDCTPNAQRSNPLGFSRTYGTVFFASPASPASRGRKAVRKPRRVVITGLGVVAPNGIGKDAFWQALVAGKSGIDEIRAFDATPFPCRVAAEVKDFNPIDFMERKNARDLWRFSQFALASAQMAVDDAKLVINGDNTHQIATCFGTCVNGFEKVEESYEAVKQHGYAGLDPLTCFQYSTHAPVSHVAIELGIKGPSMTLASGCSTGLDVVKWGYDQINEGVVRAAIVGSTEAPLSALCFSTFCALGILAKPVVDPARSSRPYDRTRDGLVLGEGGGAVVLETLEGALDRGAPIYAEVTGYGVTSEALHLRKRDTTGNALADAIGIALRRHNFQIQDIDYINAHGNSMQDNDRAETNAFKLAFGQHAYAIPVSSIKSMIGQPIAASGILQAISTALSVQNSIIPPTINYKAPDPTCDLDYVPNVARIGRIRNALVTAHALGGTHSVLALSSCKV